MRPFNDSIIGLLRPLLGEEQVDFVGLGLHNFQMVSGKLRIQNFLRVDFCIGGSEYAWDEGPCAAPVWLLVGQTPTDVILESPAAVRMLFASGDWIRLHTDEGPYEAQTFLWSNTNGGQAMEVF